MQISSIVKTSPTHR